MNLQALKQRIKSEAQVDGAGRRHLPRELREEVISAYMDSGTTCAVFAERLGLRPNQIYAWTYEQKHSRKPKKRGFKKLQLIDQMESSGGLTVNFGSRIKVTGLTVADVCQMVREMGGV